MARVPFRRCGHDVAAADRAGLRAVRGCAGGGPRWGNPELPFGGKEKDTLAGLERKVATAEAQKAAAVVLVNDASELAKGDRVPPFDYLGDATSSRIPCVHVKRSVIDPLFRSAL